MIPSSSLRSRRVVALFTVFLAALTNPHLRAGETANCDCACCVGKDTCCFQPAGGAAPYAAKMVHPLRGTVVSVAADASTVVVRHEPIPGYMPAMTMQFQVAESERVALAPGQRIRATLVHREGKFWLRAIKPEQE